MFYSPTTCIKQSRIRHFQHSPANIKNLDPLFDSVNTGNRYFNFRLQNNPSPAINKGIPAGISTDLDGKLTG